MLRILNIQDLKLRWIIDQTGTYIYNASKVIAKYLKPLAKNDFIISDTLSFPYMLKKAFNSEEYQDVSYAVESLFTNIKKQSNTFYIKFMLITQLNLSVKNY